MSLLKEASRVAAEFEYSAEDVRKGVKEFMKEMGWFSIPLQWRTSAAQIC